jgi:GrpB-like predicted nucleotidyltransferase (UPF0157 family)
MQPGNGPDSRRKVELVPYDPEWQREYERVAAEIMESCGPHVVEIHHIGSTSVPGLPAKPIIDVMPGLAAFESGFAIVEAMEGLGYEYCGEFGIPQRHYFRMRNGGGFDRNVHCYAVGDGQWHWHLAFRDHLRAHPADRDCYYQLKTELAARFPNDVESYAIAKGEFVRSIIGQYLEIDERLASR